jgi:hypothetical protein
MQKISNVVGEGSFGCVLKPSIPCANKKNISYENKVSKIMLSEEAIKELQEYAIISKIDKYQNYYLGVPIKCNPVNTKQTIKSVNKCNKISIEKNTFNDYSLLVQTNGGNDLKRFSEKLEKMSKTTENTRMIKKFWIEFHRLFRGIMNFQKYGIMHHDIKPHNIVYNQSKNRINFIDFGHMRNMVEEKKKALQSDNWIYDNAFWNYPFEIQFINNAQYLQFARKNVKGREGFFKDFIKDIKQKKDTKFVSAFNIFIKYILLDEENKDEKKKTVDKYLNAFHKMLIDDIHKDSYKSFVDKSMRTIDVYGLGMSLKYILNRCKHLMDASTVEKLEDCGFNMTTPNLMQRYTIEEAIDQYEMILSESKYLNDFGIQFENHVPIQQKKGIQKIIKSINHTDIDIPKQKMEELENSECPPGFKMNNRTKKCVRFNNKTKKILRLYRGKKFFNHGSDR